MRGRRDLLGAVMAATILTVAVAGCGSFRATPTPAAEIPEAVLAARDAALAFVQEQYEQGAPPAGLKWNGSVSSPAPSTAMTSYEFSAGDWLLAVWAPMISQDTVIFEMALRNDDTGFDWTGKLSQANEVLESNLGVGANVLVVRDLVLQYYRDLYVGAPAEGLVWMGERTTPEGSTGYEECQFASEGWLLVVDYAVTRPDQALYNVRLVGAPTGLLWRCQVNAEGEILEIQGSAG
jgi:hypothetical protein